MRFSRDLDRRTFLKLGAAGTAVAAINPSIGGASVGAKHMRVVADLQERRGNASRAKQLRSENRSGRKDQIACFTSMARVIGVAANLMERSTKFGTAMTFSRSSTIWRRISRRRRNRR